MEKNDFIKIGDVADLLGVKKNRVYQLVFEKKIPYYKPTKVLLFKRSEIIAMIEATRIKPIDEV